MISIRHHSFVTSLSCQQLEEANLKVEPTSNEVLCHIFCEHFTSMTIPLLHLLYRKSNLKRWASLAGTHLVLTP